MQHKNNSFEKRKVYNTIRDVIPYKIQYTGYTINSIQEYGFKTEQPIFKDVSIYNPVGFASTPDKDDDFYILTGSLGEKIGLCDDTYYKPQTKPNEVCVGNFKTKNYTRINDNEIKIEEEGTEVIYTKTSVKTSINSGDHIELIAEKTITIKAPNVKIEGDLEVIGNVDIKGTLTSSGVITATTGIISNGVITSTAGINSTLGMEVNGKIINDTHTHLGVTPGIGITGVVS